MNTDDTLTYAESLSLTEKKLRAEIRYWQLVRDFWSKKDVPEAAEIIRDAGIAIGELRDQIYILKCN